MATSKQTAASAKRVLLALASPEKAEFFPRFFKTQKGAYGEGDRFVGVTVPKQRQVAKQFADLPLSEIKRLLRSRIHEHRLTALIILCQSSSSEPNSGANSTLSTWSIANTSTTGT